MATEDVSAELARILPCTADNIARVHEILFAPWVRTQRLTFIDVEEGRVKARLADDSAQQFFTGAICGQAMMSAVDTVMSLAMLTLPRASKGTASQNNQFLRPAIGDDLIIEAIVLKTGGRSAYSATRVTLAVFGDLVAHSTSTHAF